ncbi:MAG TPA: DUF459 domain-containing protein [Cellvibrio sp.]|nr:DUF459 domain-containing protein [Cellvibrio sp.]
MNEIESQHHKALLAITFASLLLVAVKGSALLQYWQQTHHILLEFGSLRATSSLIPGHQHLGEWEQTLDELIADSEHRMLLAGQLLVSGDRALPRVQVPVVTPAKCPELPANNQTCPDTAVAKPAVIALTAAPTLVSGANAQVDKTAPAVTSAIDETADAQPEPLPEATPEAIAAAQGPIVLAGGERILLVGDSLMQGLAPHLVTGLKRKFHVESMDLSKHSTGLTYPAFFDWPATVEDAFELEDYAVVIVFLGANDPWDMTIHGEYLRFGSDKWKTIYRERVARIINTAVKHRARLIWLGAPPMGREDLLNKVPTLNAIYAEETAKHPLFARFVTTDPTLTADGSSFTKFLELPERGSVMVRTDDGVHFTTQGHRLLASLALTQFGAAAPPAPSPTPGDAPAPSTATTGSTLTQR